MRSVGLTGGIACGKSTVAEILREKGIPVLDLDQVARQVVAPGQPALSEIAEKWPEVVGPSGLDRRAMGALIVADPAVKAALEAITHPRIWMEMEKWLAQQTAPTVVVEAALMVETGSYRRYDRLLVVSCRPEVQRARLAAREGYDAATVEKWLATQKPLAEKEMLADAVVKNNGGREALEAEVWEAWGKICG